MPFGLKNAPKTFQHAISELFGLIKGVRVFLDDVLIHGMSVAVQVETLIIILKKN